MRKAKSQPKNHPQEISFQSFAGFEAPLLHAGLVLLQTKKAETWKPVSYRSILAGTYVTAVDLQGEVVAGIELLPVLGHEKAKQAIQHLGEARIGISPEKLGFIQGLCVREDFSGSSIEAKLLFEAAELASSQQFEICIAEGTDEKFSRVALANGFLRLDDKNLALPLPGISPKLIEYLRARHCVAVDDGDYTKS